MALEVGRQLFALAIVAASAGALGLDAACADDKEASPVTIASSVPMPSPAPPSPSPSQEPPPAAVITPIPDVWPDPVFSLHVGEGGCSWPTGSEPPDGC